MSLVFRAVIVGLLLIVTGGRELSALAAQDSATPAASGTVEPLTTATIAPDTTLVYAAVTTDIAGTQFSLAEDLVQRAGLGEYLDLAEAEVADQLAGIEDSLPLSAFGGGEAALVVTGIGFVEEAALSDQATLPGTPEAEEASGQGLAFVFAPSDPDVAGDVAEDFVTTDASSRGVSVQEVEEDGATIVVSPPDQFGDGGIAIARLDDTIVVAPTLADVQPFMDVFSGSAEPLADTEAFDRARQELSNDFLAYGFINGPSLGEVIGPVIEEAVEQGADLGISADQVLSQLSVFTAFTLWADNPGFRLDTISVPAEGAELPPIPAAFDSTLVERVPGDTLLFINGSGLGATLAPSLDMLGVLVAQAAAEDPTFPISLPEDAIAADAPGAFYEFITRFLAFNPRTDLIDQLSGEWALALWVRSADDPSEAGGVFMSGVDDEARLRDATTKLSVWANLLVIGLLSDDPAGEAILLGEEPVGASVEDVEGERTQVIDIPIPDLDTTAHVQWGIVDGQFIFSVNGDFPDPAQGGESLADSPRYQAVMEELPEERSGVFYLDLAQVIELGTQAAAEQGVDMGAFPDVSAIRALASVSFQRDDLVGTSTILFIDQSAPAQTGGISAASATESDTAPTEPTATGDDADTATYESPTYDYALTYNAETWAEVSRDDDSDDVYDHVVITNGTSVIGLTGDPDYEEADLNTCVDEYARGLELDDNTSDVELFQGQDASRSEYADRAWGIFTYVYTNEEGAEFDDIRYIECRSIGDGVTLVITHDASVDAYDDEVAVREDLLGELDLPTNR